MNPVIPNRLTTWSEMTAIWIGRGATLALLAYSPWLYGMVTWSQHVVLAYWTIAILLLATIAGALSSNYRIPRGIITVTPLLLLILGLIQTIPLPSAVAKYICPIERFESATLEKASQQAGLKNSEVEAYRQHNPSTNRTLSVYPLLSRSSLVGLACAIGMMFASSVLFRDKIGRAMLLTSLASTACIIGILGIFQSVNWKAWTLLNMPHSAFFATFVNRNSAPQFLAIGVGSIIALIAQRKWVKEKARKKSYHRRYPATSTIGKIRQVLEDLVVELDTPIILLLIGLIVLVVAIVAASSRGGVVALGFGTAVTSIFFMASDRRFILICFVALGLVAVAAGSMLNLFELDDTISKRMQDLDPSSRVELWLAALGQREYWMTGSGIGTFQFAIMPVNPMQTAWPRHAESIYVEVLSDFGIVGGLLVFAWLAKVLSLVWPTENSKRMYLWPAITFSLLTIAMHATVDFGLILPAVFLPLASLFGTFFFESESHQRSSADAFDKKFLFISVALIVAAIGWGHQSLVGFGQAEAIARHLDHSKQENANAEGLASVFEPSSKKLDYSHPEVVLQLARLRVHELELQLRGLRDWPPELTPQQRKQYSSPEFVAAVLRSTRDDQPWQSFRNFFRQHEFIAAQLKVYHQSFQFANAACPLDWRSNWGLFQTMTDNDETYSAVLWSKVDTVCSTVFDVQEITGTCNLIAGNKRIGIRAWNNALRGKPSISAKLATLVGNLLEEQDLIQIMPQHPLSVARLAKSLYPNRKEASEKLLSGVDIAKLREACQAADDWDVAAWIGEQRSDEELQNEALNKIADLQPFDLGIRLRLAKFYQQRGKLDEAVRTLEQASRRTTLPPDVQAYLKSLQERAGEASTPSD